VGRALIERHNNPELPELDLIFTAGRESGSTRTALRAVRHYASGSFREHADHPSPTIQPTNAGDVVLYLGDHRAERGGAATPSGRPAPRLRAISDTSVRSFPGSADCCGDCRTRSGAGRRSS